MITFMLAFWLSLVPSARASFTIDPDDIEERGRLWLGGVIPYVISDDFSAEQTARIKEVIDLYNTKTVVQWQPRQGEEDYVEFMIQSRGVAAGASKGRVGLRQEIRIWSSENRDVIAHEMGHTVGLLHEETRPDIARFLAFQGQRPADDGCYEAFFEKTTDKGLTLGSYDHYSIMGRANQGCVVNGTIVVRGVDETPPGWDRWRDLLTPGDIETIRQLYTRPLAAYPDRSEGTCRNRLSTGRCEIRKGDGECSSYSYASEIYKSCPVTCGLCKVTEDGWALGGTGLAPVWTKRFEKPESWQAAQATCVAAGGTLATAHSQAANARLNEQCFAPCRASGGCDYQTDCWIGLNDISREGTFYWVDGSAQDYAPPLFHGNADDRDCFLLEGHYNNGTWEGDFCSAEKHFLCEKGR